MGIIKDKRRIFSNRQRTILWILSGGFCQICGERITGTFHVDHIQPHSAGGSTLTKNGQILCPSCNFKKGSK